MSDKGRVLVEVKHKSSRSILDASVNLSPGPLKPEKNFMPRLSVSKTGGVTKVFSQYSSCGDLCTGTIILLILATGMV